MEMDFFTILNSVIAFLRENVAVSAALAVLCLYLVYRSLKLFLYLVIAVLLIAATFYAISSISSIGGYQKQKIIRQHHIP